MKNQNMKTITLSGGAVVQIPEKFKYSKCKGCDADDLIWAITQEGRNMPIHWVEGKGFVCHFSDCKHSKEFRKVKPKKTYVPKSINRLEFPPEIVRAIKNSEREKYEQR